ncbi:MAG: utilization substance protein [Verrucomicrobiota bacterium]
MSGAEGSKENRRQARVQAVQHLYGREMRGALGGNEKPPQDDAELGAFAKSLLEHSGSRLDEIDRLLAGALQNWDLKRLGAVDRAILRVAVAEMLSHPDIPAAVTINEAIEIARSLASAESARFANGVLDRVRKEIGRDPRATA